MGKIDTIILDVQHLGKPHKPFDRGAKYQGDHEVYLALKYATLLLEKFTLANYKTYLLCHGNYSDRHAWVNSNCSANSSLYIACHVNAGGGEYPLIEHTSSAMQQTRTIAYLIKKQFNASNCNFLSPAKVWEIQTGERGWGCIANTSMSALLLEPFFIDNPLHLEIAKNPYKIATVVFNAIEEFNKSGG